MSSENKFEHNGLPIVAIEAAWRKDKDGLSDLSDPSKNNGKQYAEIVGVNNPFKNSVIPNITWGTEGIGSEITNPSIGGSEVVNLKNSKVLLTTDYLIDSEVKSIYIFGDLEIRGKFETTGELNVYVMGGIYINGSTSIKSSSGDSEDINFYIYYENSNYFNNSLYINNLHEGYKTIADFYVQKGKTSVIFKKNDFIGNISSNDPFIGSIGDNGMPLDQNDSNVIIAADDSSNQINFYGSVWAPDSYVVMGGPPGIGKNAIPQKGMILGKFVEIDGLNHTKNFDYLNTILDNGGEPIIVPGEISSGTPVSVLRFNSYYVTSPN